MRIPRVLPLLAPVLLLTVLAACRDLAAPPTDDPPLLGPDVFVVDGTIRFLGLEGGCWELQAGGRTGYEPVGLPDGFRQDGLPVRVALRLRNDVGSICMIGPIAEVLWIRRR